MMAHVVTSIKVMLQTFKKPTPELTPCCNKYSSLVCEYYIVRGANTRSCNGYEKMPS